MAPSCQSDQGFPHVLTELDARSLRRRLISLIFPDWIPHYNVTSRASHPYDRGSGSLPPSLPPISFAGISFRTSTGTSDASRRAARHARPALMPWTSAVPARDTSGSSTRRTNSPLGLRVVHCAAVATMAADVRYQIRGSTLQHQRRPREVRDSIEDSSAAQRITGRSAATTRS
jgi:hypothetical protein